MSNEVDPEAAARFRLRACGVSDPSKEALALEVLRHRVVGVECDLQKAVIAGTLEQMVTQCIADRAALRDELSRANGELDACHVVLNATGVGFEHMVVHDRIAQLRNREERANDQIAEQRVLLERALQLLKFTDQGESKTAHDIQAWLES